MLTAIDFEGYRGFQKYRLGDLKTVNLLVGSNNCGKTSILEAVQILAAGGDPAVLAGIAQSRGELVYVFNELTLRPEHQTIPTAANFFFGRSLHFGSEFSIHPENRLPGVRILAKEISREALEKSWRFPDDVSQATFNLSIECPPGFDAFDPVLVSHEGAFLVARSRISSKSPSPIGIPTHYVGTETVSYDSLRGLWNRVLKEGQEGDIIRTLQILEPDVNGVFFLVDETSRAYDRSGILLGVKNSKRRLPLGSFGDGMRRLLGLAVGLACTSGGILLVDEIDTGLHWTALPEVWRLVVKAAIESGTQVFATTHSLDCLRGLSEVCDLHPDLAEHIAVHKIERALDEAVTLDANHLQIAIDQQIEMR